MNQTTRIYVLNTGGTLGMVGDPLRPAASAAELLEGIKVVPDVKLTLCDFPERLDSTNVMHKDRVVMARMIAEAYETHDAFMILHGTDSLAETCGSFTMMYKSSLQKPLFVIGAQMSKDESGTDVTMQIANTLRVAKSFVKNGVVGVFNVCIGDVLDGARVRKRRDSDFAAFFTPGVHPVAQAWPHVLIGERARRKDPVLAISGLRIDDMFEQHLVSMAVSADTPPYVLMDMARRSQPTMRGIILEGKGAGNIPDRKWKFADDEYSWIEAIAEATKAGIVVAILSPFEDGRVNLRRYALGKKASDAGALSLESLTPAMADVKLRQALARFPGDAAKIQQFLSTNIIGELLPGFESE